MNGYDDGGDDGDGIITWRAEILSFSSNEEGCPATNRAPLAAAAAAGSSSTGARDSSSLLLLRASIASSRSTLPFSGGGGEWWRAKSNTTPCHMLRLARARSTAYCCPSSFKKPLENCRSGRSCGGRRCGGRRCGGSSRRSRYFVFVYNLREFYKCILKSNQVLFVSFFYA